MRDNLTGSYFVRIFDEVVFDEARQLLPRVKDRMKLRRQTLKLRFWPAKHPVDDSGRVLDVDWSYIRTLPKSNVGELRIHDKIGGHENLRVIFFVGSPEVVDPLPIIWILAVFAKKRDELTPNQVKVFKRRRDAVVERFYKYRQ